MIVKLNIAILIYALIFFLLTSCRTVKNIETVKYVHDSTSVKQRDSVIRLYRLDSAAWNNERKSLSENQVIFRDTGSTRVEYYPDGSLKTIEGNLRSLTAKLSKEQRESSFWKSKYDSSASHKSKDSVTVRTEYVTVTKEVKRTVFPWYFFLLLLPALWVGYYIKTKLKS
jgi:hypothetical protein